MQIFPALNLLKVETNFKEGIKNMGQPYINAAIIEQFLNACAEVFKAHYGEIEISVGCELESCIEEVISVYFSENSGIPVEQVATVRAVLVAIATTNTLPLSVNRGDIEVEAYDEFEQQLELEFWE